MVWPNHTLLVYCPRKVRTVFSRLEGFGYGKDTGSIGLGLGCCIASCYQCNIFDDSLVSFSCYCFISKDVFVHCEDIWYSEPSRRTHCEADIGFDYILYGDNLRYDIIWWIFSCLDMIWLVYRFSYGHYICRSGYFTVRSILEGTGIKGATEKVRTRFLSTLFGAWKFWPMANAVNFWFVPMQFRVLYMNVLSLFWTGWLTYVNSQKIALPAEE